MKTKSSLKADYQALSNIAQAQLKQIKALEAELEYEKERADAYRTVLGSVLAIRDRKNP